MHVRMRHIVAFYAPLLVLILPYRGTSAVIYPPLLITILPIVLSTNDYTSILAMDMFTCLLLGLIVELALLLSRAEVTRVLAALISTLFGRRVCESFLTGAAWIPTFS